MQHYTVTLWSSKHETADKLFSMSFPLYATAEQPSLIDGINTVLEYASENGRARWISVGADYKGRHSNKGWQDANCLVLEWSALSSEQVIRGLQKLDLYAILLPTSQNASDKGDHVTAIVPCDARISSSKEYSRLASLLLSDIKAVGLIGGEACTFFAHARRGETAVELEGSQLFSPLDEIDRTDFVKIASYKGDAA